MNDGWPQATIADTLQLQRRWITLEPDALYTEIGVRSFGKGIFRKSPVTGLSLGNKRVLRVCPGDLVFNNVFAWEGAVAIASDGETGTIGSHRFVTYTIRDNRADARFLQLFFRTEAGLDVLRHVSPGSAGRNRTLSLVQFGKQRIPLPPLPDQQRIVAKVEELSAEIEKAKGLRSMSQEEIAGLYRIIYLKAEGEAKRGGKATPLRDLIVSHDSGWSPQCDDSPAQDSDWGVLKTTCVQWEGFAATANKALLPGLDPRPDIVVRDGDVLITRAGPTNRVGVACTVRKPPPRLMLSDKIVRIVPKDRMLPEFLSLMLGTPTAQEYFRHGKTGLAASQVNISRENLLALDICLPPLPEQRRIVAYVDELRAKTNAVKALQAQSQIELDALLPSILAKAFNGDL